MPTADLLTRILDLVQASLDDPSTSAAELASRAYLSRFHFDRLVSATVGEAPGGLRRRLLLERAAHRLTTTTRSVLEIAVEAGYGSHEAFSRAFARAYGRAPTAVRDDPGLTFRSLELPGPSGVHFNPGTLRLPAPRQETPMELLQALVDHHVDTLAAMLTRAATLPDDVLDRPIEVSVETVDGDLTLRSLLNTMVTQEEHWLSALRGGPWPDESDQSVAGLAERHARAGADYRAFVAETLANGNLADAFVDTTGEPPRTHTLGGTIGHVITFAAVRRSLALGALASAGAGDLGIGDPRPSLDAQAG